MFHKTKIFKSICAQKFKMFILNNIYTINMLSEYSISVIIIYKFLKMIYLDYSG